MNESRTCSGADTTLTQPRSASVRYELIDKDGNSHGEFQSAALASASANRLWPDQEQDPDRTGKGWDVAVMGAGQ